MQEIGEKLEPSWEALLRRALSHGVIGVDQTGWPNLERKKHKKWQMWCIAAPDVIYHTIRDDKGTRTFVDLLGTYAGVVVCDDMKTHGAGARENRALRLAGCWAHVFRKFKDCRADHPQAQIALDLIHDLYEIDARAQTLEERGALRATESKAVTERLRVWSMAQPILRTTSIGAAINYTLACWERLTRFVHDPAIWLDNNPTERGIRGPVVGRRNHFGSKSRRGTHAAAILYSLIETAKLHGVDPGAYLLEATLRAQRGPGSVLMPWELQASV